MFFMEFIVNIQCVSYSIYRAIKKNISRIVVDFNVWANEASVHLFPISFSFGTSTSFMKPKIYFVDQKLKKKNSPTKKRERYAKRLK